MWPPKYKDFQLIADMSGVFGNDYSRNIPALSDEIVNGSYAPATVTTSKGYSSMPYRY